MIGQPYVHTAVPKLSLSLYRFRIITRRIQYSGLFVMRYEPGVTIPGFRNRSQFTSLGIL